MNTPTKTYRQTFQYEPEKLFKGLDARVHDFMGRLRRRKSHQASFLAEAHEIDALADEWKGLNNHQLRERLREFRNAFRRGGPAADEVLLPAMAAIRESADRALGLRPFPVQLAGALAMHRGYLAEMATGEGKTLAAGLAAVLAGWSRKPCHVITVNDYLVKRDSEWLRLLYEACGVVVGCVTGDMSPEDRKKGYAADVTYATSREVLGDFLRDRLKLGRLSNPTRRLIREMLAPRQSAEDGMVMRGLDSAIVDEADSVLIDEAVTPLIISTPRENAALQEVVRMGHQIADPLECDVDYKVNLRFREIELTAVGKRNIAEKCKNLAGIWQGEERRNEVIKQALQAREFYKLGKQYVIIDEKIVIVDEFTGRPMPQRSWRQGMHQAIEVKEGVKPTDPSETVARLSFQRFFRFYRQLSGMTGTANEAAGELWQIYRLPVVQIPTNKPCIRERWPDRFFANQESKWDAVVEEIERIHATGRPVLVGTRSVLTSEKLAEMLSLKNLQFHLLNAVNHSEEAHIIADAGTMGRITIATNMAGRGTDIRLDKGVTELGGLHVIATERHESGRIDRQLFGRTGRQGDPGSAQAFIARDDELLEKSFKKGIGKSLRGAVASGGAPLSGAVVNLAQKRAQKLAFKQRATILRLDDWLEEALSFAGAKDV